MKQREPWCIWEQRGDEVTLHAVGSVRLGRTLRRARAHNLLTQARVFVAKKSTEGGSIPAHEPRHAAHAVHPDLALSREQVRNRAQLTLSPSRSAKRSTSGAQRGPSGIQRPSGSGTNG